MCATIKNVADNLVMYEKIGVIVNRMNDEAVLQYLDFDGVPVIATIGDDKTLPNLI